jgi:hypothetical protein
MMPPPFYLFILHPHYRRYGFFLKESLHSQAGKYVTPRLPLFTKEKHNWHWAWRYNLFMLPDLQLNDHLRLRKPHPCGSYEWTVIRLGADIGLECKGCQHRVMLTRRELAKRLKTNLTKHEDNTEKNT